MMTKPKASLDLQKHHHALAVFQHCTQLALTKNLCHSNIVPSPKWHRHNIFLCILPCPNCNWRFHPVSHSPGALVALHNPRRYVSTIPYLLSFLLVSSTHALSCPELHQLLCLLSPVAHIKPQPTFSGMANCKVLHHELMPASGFLSQVPFLCICQRPSCLASSFRRLCLADQ